jgi:hypothetical protein
MNVRCISLLCLALLTSSLFAQQAPGKGTTTFYPAKPVNPVPPEPPMMTMPLVAPLFLEGDPFSSVLTLVNNSEASTYADITLRAVDGSTVASRRVNFSPHSQRRILIAELLGEKGSTVTTGSILLMQNSALTGPSIAAALSMTYTGSAAPNYIDEEISMPSAMGSQVLQGVADRANGSPMVSISSVAEMSQSVKVECLGEHGTIATQQIELRSRRNIHR